MSVTCCDLNQLPISPAHTQGRGHSLTGSQPTANILDCRKQLLSLMTQGTAGLWSCGRTQACPQRGKNPKNLPRATQSTGTNPKHHSSSNFSSLQQSLSSFCPHLVHQFYYNKLRTREMWFSLPSQLHTEPLDPLKLCCVSSSHGNHSLVQKSIPSHLSEPPRGTWAASG